jgi:hypothetical protein
MIVTLDLCALGENNIHVECGADDAEEILGAFYAVLTMLFPECCAECAVIDKAKEILSEDEIENAEELAEHKDIICRLLSIIHEEAHSNGGHFISPDSELWLRQLADELNPASTLELIEQLRKQNAQR